MGMKRIKDAVPVNSYNSEHGIAYSIEDGQVKLMYDYTKDRIRYMRVTGIKGICSASEIATPVKEAMNMPKADHCHYLVPAISDHGHKFWLAVYDGKLLVACDTEMRADFLAVKSEWESDLSLWGLVE